MQMRCLRIFIECYIKILERLPWWHCYPKQYTTISFPLFCIDLGTFGKERLRTGRLLNFRLTSLRLFFDVFNSSFLARLKCNLENIYAFFQSDKQIVEKNKKQIPFEICHICHKYTNKKAWIDRIHFIIVLVQLFAKLYTFNRK